MGRLGRRGRLAASGWLRCLGPARVQGRGRVQGAGRGWPLTLDLQDLVTEVGLEVEGAVGREHEPQAGRRGGEGSKSPLGRGGPYRCPLPMALEAPASPPLAIGWESHGLGSWTLHSPNSPGGLRTTSPEANPHPAPYPQQPPPTHRLPSQPPPSGQQQGHEGKNAVRELACCGSGVHGPQRLGPRESRLKAGLALPR